MSSGNCPVVRPPVQPFAFVPHPSHYQVSAHTPLPPDVYLRHTHRHGSPVESGSWDRAFPVSVAGHAGGTDFNGKAKIVEALADAVAMVNGATSDTVALERAVRKIVMQRSHYAMLDPQMRTAVRSALVDAAFGDRFSAWRPPEKLTKMFPGAIHDAFVTGDSAELCASCMDLLERMRMSRMHNAGSFSSQGTRTMSLEDGRTLLMDAARRLDVPHLDALAMRAVGYVEQGGYRLRASVPMRVVDEYCLGVVGALMSVMNTDTLGKTIDGLGNVILMPDIIDRHEIVSFLGERIRDIRDDGCRRHAALTIVHALKHAVEDPFERQRIKHAAIVALFGLRSFLGDVIAGEVAAKLCALHDSAVEGGVNNLVCADIEFIARMMGSAPRAVPQRTSAVETHSVVDGL